MLWTLIIFAVVLSLDGFGVGISYGMRKIKIPLFSLIIICLSSTSALAVSMLAGNLVAALFSKELAEVLGGIALLLIGSWLLAQAWVEKLEFKDIEVKIPSIGIVIKILKEPSKADFDGSGEITCNEAIFLGLALAMDALGAGFGAAMVGLNPWLTPLVAGISKFFLINLGLYLGARSQINNLVKEFSLLPGFIIICLGFLKVFRV